MNPAKIEKLAELAEQSAARIAREATIFVCQVYSIFKDDLINSQPERTLSQTTKEIEGNRFVTLPSHNLLIAEEVAELLRVEVKTIYSWANVGKIPSLKVGSCLRFDREKVLVAIENKPQFSLPDTKPILKETKLKMVK